MTTFPFTPEKVGNFCLNCCPDPINMDVSATSGWQSTGWIVQPDQRIKITASGTVYWMGPSYTSGPDGIYHPYARIDDRFEHEAILGQVGNGPIFLVGSYYEGIPGTIGELRLVTNDTVRGDNGGSYQVRIECA